MSRLERIGPSPILAAEVAGEGEAVVMLHGVGGSRTSWQAQMAPFSAHFLAVAPDTRGYGDSEDYEGPLALSDLAADVIRVLDHVGAAQAHLVGLSMGGRVALAVYRRYPQRVRSLVLADTSAGHASASDPAQVEAALNLRIAPLLAGKAPADIAPHLLATMAGPNIAPEAEAALLRALSALRSQSYVKTMRCLTRETDFIPFRQIAAPTLVINGAEDRIARPQAARALAAEIPDHAFVLLDGVGHVSNVEDPARFNAAVLGFLQRLAPMVGEARRERA